MADKRMFSSKIINSDAFIEMSPMARILYFNLSLSADDDGFTNSIKREMRITGAKESDLKELVDKKFVIQFDSGVVLIKHWWINNKRQKDRYTETMFTEEMSLVYQKSNKEYELKSNDFSERNEPVTNLEPSWNQVATTTDTQIRGGEDRIDKDRLGKDRLGEGCACVREESSEIQADCLTPPSQESPVLYFPTKEGEQPIYQSDIDNLTHYYNGAIDVKAEILACAENSRAKPEGVSSWQTAVTKWISRTLRFKSADNVAADNRKMGTRNHRSMEPGKIIEGEEAGF